MLPTPSTITRDWKGQASSIQQDILSAFTATVDQYLAEFQATQCLNKNAAVPISGCFITPRLAARELPVLSELLDDVAGGPGFHLVFAKENVGLHGRGVRAMTAEMLRPQTVFAALLHQQVPQEAVVRVENLDSHECTSSLDL